MLNSLATDQATTRFSNLLTASIADLQSPVISRRFSLLEASEREVTRAVSDEVAFPFELERTGARRGRGETSHRVGYYGTPAKEESGSARDCAWRRTSDELRKLPHDSSGRQRRERSREGKNPSSRWRASRSVCGEFAAWTCWRRVAQLARPDANITPESRFLNC